MWRQRLFVRALRCSHVRVASAVLGASNGRIGFFTDAAQANVDIALPIQAKIALDAMYDAWLRDRSPLELHTRRYDLLRLACLLEARRAALFLIANIAGSANCVVELLKKMRCSASYAPERSGASSQAAMRRNRAQFLLAAAFVEHLLITRPRDLSADAAMAESFRVLERHMREQLSSNNPFFVADHLYVAAVLSINGLMGEWRRHSPHAPSPDCCVIQHMHPSVSRILKFSHATMGGQYRPIADNVRFDGVVDCLMGTGRVHQALAVAAQCPPGGVDLITTTAAAVGIDADKSGAVRVSADALIGAIACRTMTQGECDKLRSIMPRTAADAWAYWMRLLARTAGALASFKMLRGAQSMALGELIETLVTPDACTEHGVSRLDVAGAPATMRVACMNLLAIAPHSGDLRQQSLAHMSQSHEFAASWDVKAMLFKLGVLSVTARGQQMQDPSVVLALSVGRLDDNDRMQMGALWALSCARRASLALAAANGEGITADLNRSLLSCPAQVACALTFRSLDVSAAEEFLQWALRTENVLTRCHNDDILFFMLDKCSEAIWCGIRRPAVMRSTPLVTPLRPDDAEDLTAWCRLLCMLAQRLGSVDEYRVLRALSLVSLALQQLVDAPHAAGLSSSLMALACNIAAQSRGWNMDTANKVVHSVVLDLLIYDL